MAKGFVELAKEFSTVSGPDAVALQSLTDEAWYLLIQSADKIEWQLFGIDSGYITRPGSNWELFADEAGRSGNVRDAHPDVVHSQTWRDGYDWRAKSTGNAAVCRWLNEVVASCSQADHLKRLAYLARRHSEVYAWKRLWDWRDSLKEYDEQIAIRERLRSHRRRTETTPVEEHEDDSTLNIYCHGRAITLSDLTKMMRDFYILEQGLRTWYPELLELLPRVNTDNPRPTDEKMNEWADRCRKIEARLLTVELKEDGKRLDKQPEAKDEPTKPVETLAGGDVPPAEAEFVFRPDGDGYFIKGFGEQGHFSAKGAKGLHDLYRVFQSPGFRVPMLELDAGPGVTQAEGDERSNQPMLDHDGFKNIAEKLRRLRVDIDGIDSTSPDSDMERGELVTKRDELLAELNKVRGKGGKVRDLNASDLNRMKSNISGRIKTVCKQIEKRYPLLSKHFRDTTGAVNGVFYVYTPGVPDMRWDTESKMVGHDPTK